MSQRKKFCECCKIMIPYTRSAIQDHEGSHKHKKNQERELMTAHIKARKEHKNFSKEDDSIFKTLDRGKNKNSGSGNQNPQQSKKELENKQNRRLDQIEEKVIIADQDQFFNGRVWILEKEDDTQKLRFRNTLTGLLKYDRPIGLMLEDYEEEAWDTYEKDRPAGPAVPKEHTVKIGDWEEVKQGEGYFDRKYEDSQSLNDQNNEDYIDVIEKKVAEGILQKKADIVKEFILQGGSERNFNSRLRELAEKDIDLDIPIPQIQRSHSPPKNTGSLFKKRINNQKQTILIEKQELTFNSQQL